MGVLLEEGIGCKPTGLAAGSAEEIAVDVIGDAGRFDIIVQTLIETMMAGNVVLLAAFFVQAHPTAAPLDKIVADLHLNDGPIRAKLKTIIAIKARSRSRRRSG